MAPLKVYVASATANPETKYRVQRTLMILDGLGIPFDSIDITKPEKAEERRFMRENAHKEEDKDSRAPILPPQFFYNDEYLGDYEDFDASVEADTIAQFLRLLPDTIESNADSSPATQEEDNSKTTAHETVANDEEQSDEGEEWEDEDEAESEETPEKESTSVENGIEKKADDEKVNDDDEVVETATISLPTAKQKETAEDEEIDEEEMEGEDEEWDEDEEEVE